jgi:ABC-type microcin C transport system permease subunit YejE
MSFFTPVKTESTEVIFDSDFNENVERELTTIQKSINKRNININYDTNDYHINTNNNDEKPVDKVLGVLKKTEHFGNKITIWGVRFIIVVFVLDYFFGGFINW